jgi:hypothetical protein
VTYGTAAVIGGWLTLCIATHDASSALSCLRETIPTLLWFVAMAPFGFDTGIAAGVLVLPLYLFLRGERPRYWMLSLPLLASAYLMAVTPLRK